MFSVEGGRPNFEIFSTQIQFVLCQCCCTYASVCVYVCCGYSTVYYLNHVHDDDDDDGCVYGKLHIFSFICRIHTNTHILIVTVTDTIMSEQCVWIRAESFRQAFSCMWSVNTCACNGSGEYQHTYPQHNHTTLPMHCLRSFLLENAAVATTRQNELVLFFCIFSLFAERHTKLWKMWKIFTYTHSIKIHAMRKYIAVLFTYNKAVNKYMQRYACAQFFLSYIWIQEK